MTFYTYLQGSKFNQMKQLIPSSQNSTFLKISMILSFSCIAFWATAQNTLLLRQPSISEDKIAFSYGGDIWSSDKDGSNVKRITSTAAVEGVPMLSPDGAWIAFASNRSGTYDVYLVSSEGGMARRLTWHPDGALPRGWTSDGSEVLFSSTKGTAPGRTNRLWTISPEESNPKLLSMQSAIMGSFSSDGKQIVIDQTSRWDGEWRDYRGGQNTPLVVLDLESNEETIIPSDWTSERNPLWLGDMIYFLSDREGVMNIWAYSPYYPSVQQITKFEGSDIKWLAGHGQELVYVRDGQIFLMDIGTKQSIAINVEVIADFPWAAEKWEDVTQDAGNVSVSATGKRIIMEARGDIFTVPIEHGNARNITKSSGTADRRPIWSPKGDKIAWFTDEGNKDYRLRISDQDGENYEDISLGESKLGWTPSWSPDGEMIAFVDDDLRVRVLDVSKKTIKTVGLGGVNIERGDMGLSWSPDSRWLAYSRSGDNFFRQVMIWSKEDGSTNPITNEFADAFSPAWDADMKHLYFLASTDVALGSGWANTSSMTANPAYAAYVINLDSEDKTPFAPKSDEEEVAEDEEDAEKSDEAEEEQSEEDESEDTEETEEDVVKIDFANADRRTIALPIPTRRYVSIIPSAAGSMFLLERIDNQQGLTMHQFKLEDQKIEEYTTGVRSATLSPDGKQVLVQSNGGWKLASVAGPFSNGKSIKVKLRTKLNRQAEWKQIFEEAWRYQRDYFYDSNMHGRDWQEVYERYAPLVSHVRHRADLNYILDMMNGELSVGHSFVFGGDFPDTDRSRVGLLGADLAQRNNRWMIQRIYTTENWNPELTSPLDQPGMKVERGNYIIEIDGESLTSQDNIYEMLDGTSGEQTVLTLSASADGDDSWEIIIEPIRSERQLRQRAWVEDNRRLVDSLSGGKLAYVWVPNTGTQGLVSFNRYFFAQQNKQGAVIDERFNGGGFLDDYMVDLLNRELRAAYTNEVPGAKPGTLPAGIYGPKALLINEMAGSGGDFFPWVFRQQNTGLLIGTKTWGGLVKSSVHYGFIDGGAMTAPDNAIFDPIKNEWIAENVGVAPDIVVRQDAKSIEKGQDPQLERAVEELMKQLKPQQEVTPPPYPNHAKRSQN